MSPRRPKSAKLRRKSDGFALGWHLAWGLVTAAAAGGLALAGRLPPGPELAALGAGTVAAILGAGLAQLAAAAAFRRPGLLSAGAAGSVAAAAVATLGAVLAPGPSVSPELAPWMSLLSLTTVTLGFGTAALSLLARTHAELRGRADT